MRFAAGNLRYSGSDECPDQGGFTLVFFAISIVALLGIAALVVDLGYWYLHADRIQRAADSAALAGVVYMPGNPNEATSVATSVAASNGFSGSGVVVSPVPGELHELQVTIKDTNVPAFFAKVFGFDKISETRTSIARYQPPVPLGSAENSFGTGDLSLGVGPPSNIWAAVNGYCTSKENGDQLLSKYDATYNGSTYDCPANPADPATPHATTNFEYNPSGYLYDIETPDQTQGTLTTELTVSAYDPSFNPIGCGGGGGGETPDNNINQANPSIHTTYTLYYNPTPLNPPTAANELSTITFGTNDMASCGKWVPIGTIPAGAANGTYQLQVATQAGEANSQGTNGYGLEVNVGPFGAFSRCSTITSQPWYNANCPVIQGHNFLSVYAKNGSNTGTFYLADVDSAYDGKTMEITLFDPG
ncbi:MAG TPA: Tad domain-containing protein, partial [Acidimicrobiales bacterium]|nr:Tad domain-containing protein [Acidimicrobiales bacterium]